MATTTPTLTEVTDMDNILRKMPVATPAESAIKIFRVVLFRIMVVIDLHSGHCRPHSILDSIDCRLDIVEIQ